MLEIKVGRTALILMTLVIGLLLFQSRPTVKPEDAPRERPKQYPPVPKYKGSPEVESIIDDYDREAAGRVRSAMEGYNAYPAK